MAKRHVFIGAAGWAIPREQAGAFPAEGSQLQRYAAHMNIASGAALANAKQLVQML